MLYIELKTLPMQNYALKQESARLIYLKTIIQLICFELIHLQKTQYGLLRNMWGIAFSPILNALQGESMTLNNDDKVLDLLKSKLFTVNKKGVVSYTKANNAYNFYLRLKNDGFDKTKIHTAKATFYENIKNLTDCGLSKSLSGQKPA
ncbi:phage/plasmid replication protein, II/X family [Moraxella ovis]|uniref:phage/plasmid replication protein, II/X family n=1 Tax=Moraxella ovis TaxID=29433 RepID=UPI000E054D77|nr:phage/plasmid replication protein, II/X family [Moraxella ovis]STZ31520.1 phage/plasmid replication protein, gene II/X family [Moraxella ovis]